MNKQNHDHLKKEVLKNILGTTLGVRLQGNAPILFRQLYYDRIASAEEKEHVREVLLEILSRKYIFPRYKLRCFAAYVASDIGLIDVVPFVQQLASITAIQRSSFILLIERTLEKLKVPHEFTHEQMMHIVIYKITGRHEAVHSRGEIIYDFKKEFYGVSSPEKKEMIKQALTDILTNFRHLKQKRLLCDAAYIASDIGLLEAKPIIERMVLDKSLRKSKEYGTLLRALEKFKEP